MRLVHILPALTQEASGPSYSVRRLCDELVNLNQDVSLATLDWEPIQSPPHYLKTFPLGRGPARLGASPKMYDWLRSTAKAEELAVFHNHGMWQFNSVYPAWAARGTGTRVVFSPRGAFSAWAMQHGSPMKKVFWRLLQHPALRRASCFHATAEAEYLDIRRLGFKQPVAIIPNGIDMPAELPRTPGQPRTLLFLGRIHLVKGLDFLLEAWRSVQEKFPEWHLKIIGGDDGYNGSSGYLSELKVRAQELDLDRIHFLGPHYGQAKQQAYRDADLYVLPSRSENFAMTVAESLAIGTPVIVSKGAPWPGLEQQGAGWWIDTGAAPLAACLEQALACSAVQLAAMGGRGRAWMRQSFSWPHAAESMLSTYEWLCDRSLEVPDCIQLN